VPSLPVLSGQECISTLRKLGQGRQRIELEGAPEFLVKQVRRLPERRAFLVARILFG
jgi:hypothetical protein